MLIDEYITYIRDVRRYSSRTQQIYAAALRDFALYSCAGEDAVSGIPSVTSDGGRPISTGRTQTTAAQAVSDCGGGTQAVVPVATGGQREVSDEELLLALKPLSIRNYEVWLLDDKKESPRTVNLQLSVLSGFCKWLMGRGVLNSNPVRMVSRPKMRKRLPDFYKKEAIEKYLTDTQPYASEDTLLLLQKGDRESLKLHEKRQRRLIVSLLYCTAIRRSELIGLKLSSVDFARKTLRVLGKGDKMREIPLVPALCEEISLYLRSLSAVTGRKKQPSEPLLQTLGGESLYPMYVDRAIKEELGTVKEITGRKSPHVLRHTLATELLSDGSDLNSIKELLGHSSLAATQVYTHNSAEKLRAAYMKAHPRAKKVSSNGEDRGEAEV